jgi:mRNA-degrading endonuclease toxin of MazEF toxin-antitoxin module
MDALGPGRIFWAIYPGGRGDGKKRPMVVATRRTDILRTGRLVAVVCSTDFEEPLESIEVRLPSHPEGRCATHLKYDTVAVCDWIAPFQASDIRETGGLVSATLLKEICRLAGLDYPSER